MLVMLNKLLMIINNIIGEIIILKDYYFWSVSFTLIKKITCLPTVYTVH